ncbi:MAG: hypothetical protein WC536_03755 [Patescibacteria group bacterium]
MVESGQQPPQELEGLRGDLVNLKHEEISSEEDEILAEISKARQEIENNPEKFEEILASLDADALLLKRILEEKKKFWGLGEKISNITVDKIQNEKWKKVLKIGAKLGGGIIASRLISIGVKSAFNVSNPVTGAISGAAMGGFWGYVRGKDKTESANAWMKELNIEELETETVDEYSNEDLGKVIGILKNAIEDGKNGRMRGNAVSKINLARKYRVANKELVRRTNEIEQDESGSVIDRIDELSQDAEVEGKAISELSGREHEELYKILTERNKYTVVKEGIKGALVGAGVGYVANWAMDKIFHVDGNSAKDAALEAKKESIRQAHDAKIDQFGNNDLHSFNTDQTTHLQLVETKGDLHGFNDTELSSFTESVNKSGNVWELIRDSHSDLHNIDLQAPIDGETGKNIGQFILEHKEAFSNLDPNIQREMLSFPSLAEDIFKAATENSSASASAISGNALGTLGLAAIGSGGIYALAAKKEKVANEKIEAYEPRQQSASGGGDSGPDGTPSPDAGGTSEQKPRIVAPKGRFDDSNLGEGGLAENNGVNPVGLVESKPVDVEKYNPTKEDYKNAEEFWKINAGKKEVKEHLDEWLSIFINQGKFNLRINGDEISEVEALEVAAYKIMIFEKGCGIGEIKIERNNGVYSAEAEIVALNGGASEKPELSPQAAGVASEGVNAEAEDYGNKEWISREAGVVLHGAHGSIAVNAGDVVTEKLGNRFTIRELYVDENQDNIKIVWEDGSDNVNTSDKWYEFFWEAKQREEVGGGTGLSNEGEDEPEVFVPRKLNPDRAEGLIKSASENNTNLNIPELGLQKFNVNNSDQVVLLGDLGDNLDYLKQDIDFGFVRINEIQGELREKGVQTPDYKFSIENGENFIESYLEPLNVFMEKIYNHLPHNKVELPPNIESQDLSEAIERFESGFEKVKAKLEFFGESAKIEKVQNFLSLARAIRDNDIQKINPKSISNVIMQTWHPYNSNKETNWIYKNAEVLNQLLKEKLKGFDYEIIDEEDLIGHEFIPSICRSIALEVQNKENKGKIIALKGDKITGAGPGALIFKGKLEYPALTVLGVDGFKIDLGKGKEISLDLNSVYRIKDGDKEEFIKFHWLREIHGEYLVNLEVSDYGVPLSKEGLIRFINRYSIEKIEGEVDLGKTEKAYANQLLEEFRK